MTYSEKAVLKAQCKINYLADGNLSVKSMQSICLDCFDGKNGELGAFIDEATKDVKMIASGYTKK